MINSLNSTTQNRLKPYRTTNTKLIISFFFMFYSDRNQVYFEHDNIYSSVQFLCNADWDSTHVLQTYRSTQSRILFFFVLLFAHALDWGCAHVHMRWSTQWVSAHSLHPNEVYRLGKLHFQRHSPFDGLTSHWGNKEILWNVNICPTHKYTRWQGPPNIAIPSP